MILRLWLFVVLACAGAFAPSRACARTAETRTWDFFATATNARPEVALQVADSRPGFAVCGYELASGYSQAAETIANPIPGTMARVIPNGRAVTTLGRPGAADVFVTAADDIAGMNSAQIAKRLTIPQSPTGFRVIEFPTPSQGVATPVFRTDPGFIQGGRTLGGAREFVIPNQPLPPGWSVRIVPPGGG